LHNLIEETGEISDLKMKQKENKTKARINEFKESVDERKEDEI
jgi:hypothetical protein